jgi:hypothetical protein
VSGRGNREPPDARLRALWRGRVDRGSAVARRVKRRDSAGRHRTGARDRRQVVELPRFAGRAVGRHRGDPRPTGRGARTSGPIERRCGRRTARAGRRGTRRRRWIGRVASGRWLGGAHGRVARSSGVHGCVRPADLPRRDFGPRAGLGRSGGCRATGRGCWGSRGGRRPTGRGSAGDSRARPACLGTGGGRTGDGRAGPASLGASRGGRPTGRRSVWYGRTDPRSRRSGRGGRTGPGRR